METVTGNLCSETSIQIKKKRLSKKKNSAISIHNNKKLIDIRKHEKFSGI